MLLSTAFVACTNEDMIENLPANGEGAVALGEGYAINVAKDLGVESRAAFSNYSPYWEEGDKIGAAWFNEVTALNPNNDQIVTAVGDPWDKFRSNHPFELVDGEGTGRGTFESVTNAFAGAYMLYYPYTDAISKTGEYITVNSIPGTQVMDCTPGNEWDVVNENMFAYGTAKFVPGGPTTEEFVMNQIPVLYRLHFQFAKAKFLDLVDGVSIEKVIVEAEKGGKSVLVTEARLYAPTASVAKENYNNNTLPSAEYKSINNVDHYSINLLNSDADEYKIYALNTPTALPVIFSTLPFEEEADKVTFKIVTSNGYVFYRTYTAKDDADAVKYINGTYDNDGDGKADKDGAAFQGGNILFTVTLDSQELDDVAYTTEQFMEQWEEALASNKNMTITYGEDLVLDEALTFDNESNAVITVKAHCDNHSLTINALNVEDGNIVFASPLIVTGDVVSEAEGNLKADNITAENITANGYATLTVASADLLTIAASGEVTLSDVNAASAGVAEINVNSAGAAYGKLTMKNIKIPALINNGNVIVEEGVSLASTGTIENDYSFQVKKQFTNKGTFNQNNKLTTTEAFTNAAGAILNIAKEGSNLIIVNQAKDVTYNIPAGVINLDLATTSKAISLKNGSKNEGTINLNKGTLNLASNFVYQKAGDITVAEEAYINLNNINTMDGGRVIVASDGVFEKIAANNLYYAVNNADDLKTLPAYAKVKNLIFNASISATIDIKNFNWWLENATVTLTADYTMGGTLNVTGNATIKSDDLDVIRTLTLKPSSANQVIKNAVLTLKAVKVKNGTAKLVSEGSINALNGSTFNVNSTEL